MGLHGGRPSKSILDYMCNPPAQATVQVHIIGLSSSLPLTASFICIPHTKHRPQFKAMLSASTCSESSSCLCAPHTTQATVQVHAIGLNMADLFSVLGLYAAFQVCSDPHAALCRSLIEALLVLMLAHAC
eukprot:1158332-Pelagomonas_calceolata.AAC.4